jgi:dihydroorotate dehydrogenase electron transfer subunit
VTENRSLGRGGFVLRLSPLPPLAAAQPGQFVMLRGDWGRDPLLPRAFSLLDVDADGASSILIKAIGRGTRLFEAALPGARVTVLGPLGRRFPAPERGVTDLLVAGGVGLAPLYWHARRAVEAGGDAELLYGARSAADLVLLDEIAAVGCPLRVTTEDGSAGLRGRVTAALEERLGRDPAGVRVLTCGPNAMMRAVVEISRARRVACFVSVEGEMACGIGACLGCAVKAAGADPDRPFAYACVDGPVFDADRIVIP